MMMHARTYVLFQWLKAHPEIVESLSWEILREETRSKIESYIQQDLETKERIDIVKDIFGGDFSSDIHAYFKTFEETPIHSVIQDAFLRLAKMQGEDVEACAHAMKPEAFMMRGEQLQRLIDYYQDLLDNPPECDAAKPGCEAA